VQEIEDIDTLRQFVRDDLAGLYRHVVLIEGNDSGRIDVGLLSKLPLGGVTSFGPRARTKRCEVRHRTRTSFPERRP
jgi:hypothetical protein